MNKMSTPDTTASEDEEVEDLTEDIQKTDGHYSHCGEFTDIWKVKWDHRNKEHTKFAVKAVREIVYDSERRNNVTKSLLSVYKLWARVTKSNHPNIVPFYGIVHGFGNFPSPVIPYYANGNVLEFISKYPNTNKLSIVSDIASGLLHIHTLPERISHGNLKASNVLIADDGHACISDIRIYLVVSQSDFTTASVAGPSRWMAPEIMDPPEDNVCEDGFENDVAQTTSTAADIYSFAMTVLEVYTGKHPFVHKRNDAAVVLDVMKGLRPTRPETNEVTDNLWHLMQECWVMDPKSRPPIDVVQSRLLCM